MFTLLEEYDVQATRKEAREEGKQEGEYNKALEIAKGLIGLLDIHTIAEKTGLPIEVVKEIAENN